MDARDLELRAVRRDLMELRRKYQHALRELEHWKKLYEALKASRSDP